MNNDQFTSANLSITEKCQKIGKALRYCDRNSSYHISYDTIAPYMTDDVIKYISYHPQGKMTLHFIARSLNRLSKHLFFEKIYALRKEISPRELMRMYLDAMEEKNDIFENIRLQEQPTSPLEVTLSKAWGYVRPFKGKRINIACGIENALDNDSPAAFIMYSNMTGQKMSRSLLSMILRKEAVEILAYLIQHDLVPWKIMSRNALVSYCISNMSDEKAVKFLKAIDKAMPGYIKNFTDGYGRNLLWHAMYNCFWNAPVNVVVQYLLAAGCSPENRNALGLTWRYCRIMYAPVIAGKEPVCLQHINLLTEKNIFYHIRRFQECSTQEGHIGLPKIIVFSRSRSSAPLLEETVKLLDSDLRETFWNFAFCPEKTLPEAWQKNLIYTGENIVLPEKLQNIARNAMKSYGHPDACGQPEFKNFHLLNIPVLEEKKRGKGDHGFSKAMKIMKTGLLMYNPVLIGYLLEKHYDLCKTLRFIYMPLVRKSIPEDLIQTIEQDDVRKFAEQNDADEDYNFEVIDTVLRRNKPGILSYLLDNSIKLISSFPPQEMVLYAASQLNDTAGTELLNALENRWPKIIRESFDCFGSNALYHTIFNKNIRWYAPDCRLVRFLKNNGCRFQAVNKFGIAPMDVRQIINENDIALREEYLKLIG